MKQTFAAVALATALFCTLPAAADSTNAASTEGVTYTIGYSCADSEDSYSAALLAEVKARVEASGNTLVVMDAASDALKQKSQLLSLTRKGVDGIFLEPVSSRGLTDGLDAIRDAQIPLIGLDQELSDMSYLTSYTGMDEFKAGQMLADVLKETLEDNDSILVLTNQRDSKDVERIAGLTSELADVFSLQKKEEDVSILIAASADGGGTRAGAKVAAAEMLQDHKSVTAIVAGDDTMAAGALDAAAEARFKNLKIYGFSGSPKMKSALTAEGTMLTGTMAASPVAIAGVAVQLMDGCLAGQNLDMRYLVEPFLITAENVGQYSLDAWQ